jgi:hypothetical protein
MTSSQDDGPSQDDLRAQLERVDAEQAELLQEARNVRAELVDAGPMDAEDRSAIITRAEELEAFAAELGRRRETLLQKLGRSS